MARHTHVVPTGRKAGSQHRPKTYVVAVKYQRYDPLLVFSSSLVRQGETEVLAQRWYL
jgi:hypothetical protein